MRFREFKIAHLSGVPLIIDYTWPLVAIAHVWLLTSIFLPVQLYQQTDVPRWEMFLCALVMTFLLFVSIVIHELGHVGAAKLEGIKTIEIRLHFFGGWAKLAQEPQNPMAEFRIAALGPVSSFLLSLIFLAGRQIAVAFNPERSLWSEAFGYLFLGNILLAMFNLLPGLPLDGGRVFRAWLWHRKKDILAASRTATHMGIALSYMLISFGIYRLFSERDVVSASGLIAVGYFLKTSAENEYRYRRMVRDYELAMQEAAQHNRATWNVDGTVGKVMSVPAVSVLPDQRISEFIDEVLTAHRHTSFPVARDGRLHGILSLARLREVPEERWKQTRVSEVMQPVDDSLFVNVRSSIEHANHKLRLNSVQHLAVLDGEGVLVGYLSAADLGQ